MKKQTFIIAITAVLGVSAATIAIKKNANTFSSNSGSLELFGKKIGDLISDKLDCKQSSTSYEDICSRTDTPPGGWSYGERHGYLACNFPVDEKEPFVKSIVLCKTELSNKVGRIEVTLRSHKQDDPKFVAAILKKLDQKYGHDDPVDENADNIGPSSPILESARRHLYSIIKNDEQIMARHLSSDETFIVLISKQGEESLHKELLESLEKERTAAREQNSRELEQATNEVNSGI